MIIHSDSSWLMAFSLLTSVMLESATLGFSHLVISLRFTKNTLHYTLTLTQVNSIWLNLIHSDPILMMAAILNSAILNLAILDSAILHKKIHSLAKIWFPFISPITLHSFILPQHWWWQPSWILPSWIKTLPSWIQTPCYLLSDWLKNTLTPLCLWLKLIQSKIRGLLKIIQSDSNSFILTQLDDGSHLEFCHVGLEPFCTFKETSS